MMLDWSSAAAAGAAIAGGKGWHLGRMAELGVPVPDGFVLAAQCSRGRAPGAPLAPAVVEALAGELERRGWSGVPLAVRSSAVQEDGEDASFAGIHLSRLNVVGIDALAQAVTDIWDSAWSETATAYRHRLGMADGDRAIAVVVMPLLPAQAAGIAFTCDPVSGRDDHLIVNAHWGLGEALVGGHADGDEYRLEIQPDDTAAEISRRIGSKRQLTCPTAAGTELRDTPADMAARAVLTPDQVLELAWLARDAAAALDYTRPLYDVEWVWDGTRFWIVQARPVTAMGRHTYDALRDQPALWSRGNTRDVLPEPLSPMDWGGSRLLVDRMLSLGWQLAGYPVLPGVRRAALFHGHLYLESALMQWEAYDALGVPPKLINELMGGSQPEITMPPPTRRQKLARAGRLLRYILRSAPIRKRAEDSLRQAHDMAAEWRCRPLPPDAEQLAVLAREHLACMSRMDDVLFLQGSSGGGLSNLLKLLERYLPGQGHALAAALMAGGAPSVTARQGYELIELAKIAENDAAALAWLRAPDRIDSQWDVALPADSAFRNAFAVFLDRYGHRAVAETYMRSPRWREQPGYLLDVVLGLRGTDAEVLRRRQAEAAEAAWREVNARLPAWLRPLLRRMVRTATTECNHREAARSALMAQVEISRRLLLALADTVVGPYGLERCEDIFNLTGAEALDVAEGRLMPRFAARRAAMRRALLEQWMNEREPDVIALHKPVKLPHAATRHAADGDWRGTPVGAGLAQGRALVARNPGEGTAMRTGDILVAPSTDPAWTPLFLRAGGLVMETGGYLSHGAIVAREFGIPAVVNMPGILERLRSGQMLEVDGDGGRVRRLAPQPAH